MRAQATRGASRDPAGESTDRYWRQVEAVRNKLERTERQSARYQKLLCIAQQTTALMSGTAVFARAMYLRRQSMFSTDALEGPGDKLVSIGQPIPVLPRCRDLLQSQPPTEGTCGGNECTRF